LKDDKNQKKTLHSDNPMVKVGLFNWIDFAGSPICYILEEYHFFLCCLPFSSSISFSCTEVWYCLFYCNLQACGAFAM